MILFLGKKKSGCIFDGVVVAISIFGGYICDLTLNEKHCHPPQPVLFTDLQTSTRLSPVFILGRFLGWTGGVSVLWV